MLTPSPFSTDRLVFRAVEPADCEANGFLVDLLRHESVQLGAAAMATVPLSQQGVKDFFAPFDKSPIHHVFMTKPDSNRDARAGGRSGEAVGWVTIERIQWTHRKATFGLVVHPKFQGKGFAKEAMEWLLERAFVGFGLNKLEADVFTWNEPALAVYKSLGFIVEGCRRQTIFQQGRFWDDYFIGLLASDWHERQRAKSEQ
ncbi:hypothetical protein JCM10212_001255 [Sporobolomyces blumeae]